MAQLGHTIEALTCGQTPSRLALELGQAQLASRQRAKASATAAAPGWRVTEICLKE